MSFLSTNWKLFLLTTAVAGVAIFAFFPDYNTLQMSKDAKDFTSTLGDDAGRATAANISDLVFALSYGTLGLVAFNKLATGKVALIGSLLTIAAAVADEIENVLVFLNIKADSLTDGRVDLMTTVGAVKWALVGISILLLIVLATRARRSNAS